MDYGICAYKQRICQTESQVEGLKNPTNTICRTVTRKGISYFTIWFLVRVLIQIRKALMNTTKYL